MDGPQNNFIRNEYLDHCIIIIVMAEKKCLIDSTEGCIIEDETAIVLAVSAAVAVALALPLLATLASIAPKIPPAPPG